MMRMGSVETNLDAYKGDAVQYRTLIDYRSASSSINRPALVASVIR